MNRLTNKDYMLLIKTINRRQYKIENKKSIIKVLKQ